MSERRVPEARDSLLFTPGPLTTSLSVKQAMLHDAGSWHFAFNAVVAQVRQRLLALAGTSTEAGYEAILMQGSGTFGVESVITSTVPRGGRLLVIANGAYGERIIAIAEMAGIETRALRYPEDEPADPSDVLGVLREDERLTSVAVVHCETTTGILNPIESIGRVVKEHGRSYIVDAMSSFGGMPINVKALGIDYLVSSANKCIEGVPGFSFVIARRESLLSCEGYARSLSLDLFGQWNGFERSGQFRFTPPTHALLAFAQALDELEQEGGIEARGARYRRNHETLMAGMLSMGFRAHLQPGVQSYIITSFHYPEHPRFEFSEFYKRLSDRGMIIYPGKLTKLPCFRIGTIGRIFEPDVRQLLSAIGDVMRDMACND